MTKAKSGSIALVTGRTRQADGHPHRRRLPPLRALRARASSTSPSPDFMTRTPKMIRDDALGVDALRLFEAHKIDDLIVVDARGRPVGLIDGQDLPKFKIV